MFTLASNRPVTYFKRFKMEIGLYEAPPLPVLPPGYYWVPWEHSLIDSHAEVMYGCFQEEIDAQVFPSLATYGGCVSLMQAIRGKPGFIPGATWLIAQGIDYCGTVQGVRERNGMGAIQNLGVLPAHRGRGLGAALLLQALHGFRTAGLPRAFLEVTAQNEAAIRLYRRIGFRSRKTVYKAVETTFVLSAGEPVF